MAGSPSSRVTRAESLALMCEAAVAVERAPWVQGCPAEMLVAQCAVEAGWPAGFHAPGWNALGFKNYAGSYGRQLLETQEWFTVEEAADFAARDPARSIKLAEPERVNGTKRLYEVTDWFATFPSLEACFARRAQRWANGQGLSWVKAYHQTKDLHAMFLEMAKGYATASATTYAKAMMDRLAMPEVREALAKARAPMIPT